MKQKASRALRRAAAASLLSLACVLAQGDFSAAEKNAQHYNKKGWEYLERGDSFRAITSFKSSLRQNPRFRDALLGLGKAYLSTEGYDESIRLFTEVLRLDRDNIEALAGMGYAMLSLGRNRDALQYFEKVESLSGESLEAKYGTALLYYRMGKRIWARRKIESILRINPYHYRALLLMADIKADDGRLDDARKLIDKAVESDRELPEGYVKAGLILYRYYLREEDGDYLEDAVEELEKAIAIRPEDFAANRYRGYLAIVQGRYDDARRYFERAVSSFPESAPARYSLALAQEREGDLEGALASLAKAMELAPSDDTARSKAEDLLVMNSFKIGHPLRVRLAKEHLARANRKMREHLSDEAMLHLRRSLYLNPMNKEARERLRDYYETLNYYRFYIDEMKDLARMYPDESYQDSLGIAVMKRRSRLYYKAGFSGDPPARDVPGVLVLDLWPESAVAAHPDAGAVLANYLSFALGQFGRQDAVRIKPRQDIMRKLRSGESFLGDTIEALGEMAKRGEVERLRYVIYGSYDEGSEHMRAGFKILDFKTGVIISEFDLAESGKENLERLSLRAARKVYDLIPYQGRVLKVDDEQERVLVNLGIYDGLKPGDLLVMYRYDTSPAEGRINMKRKLLFAVDEVDTLVASAKPKTPDDLARVDEGEPVYPLNKRRAKLLK